MPTYNFKRDSKVFLVYGGLRYDLPVYDDFSGSQTFEESSVRRKTLHDIYYPFDSAVIIRANPLSFNLTTPLITALDNKILHDLLIGYATDGNLLSFDLYVQSNVDIYKFEKCVLETGTYQISSAEIPLLSVSGSGSKFSRYTSDLPGTLQARTANLGYWAPTKIEVNKNGVVQSSVRALNLEINNRVSWVPNQTIHDALNVVTSTNTLYPKDYSLESREITGTIQEYITSDNNTDVHNWGEGEYLTISVGSQADGYQIIFSIPSIVYSNRVSMEDIFIKTYDIRATDSYISNLATVIQYH